MESRPRKKRIGVMSFQRKILPEHAEQVKIAVYATKMGYQFFAIPNGGKRSIPEAMRLKQAGVKAGIPDLFFPEPRGKYHGLFIEVKRAKESRTSDAQKYWLEMLNKLGYKAVVVKGFEQAKIAIDEYMTQVL